MLPLPSASSGDWGILMTVYWECGGSEWVTSTNWGTNAQLDEWYGVKTKEGAVVSLNLSDNNLKGERSYEGLTFRTKSATALS